MTKLSSIMLKKIAIYATMDVIGLIILFEFHIWHILMPICGFIISMA